MWLAGNLKPFMTDNKIMCQGVAGPWFSFNSFSHAMNVCVWIVEEHSSAYGFCGCGIFL